MSFEGGYYNIKQSLIRDGLYSHTASCPDCISDRALDAVNILQETPWRVNAWILDLMRQSWIDGDGLGILPSPFDEPEPARIETKEWAALTPKEQGRVKAERAKLHERNAKATGKRSSFLRKLEVAEAMRDDSSIWFPHFLDFRGRVYPMAQDLNPQGDDIAKAMLMFSQGKPLGEAGLYWLAIRLANTFGNDKLSFDERLAWVIDNERLIRDSANNPLDGERFWLEADTNGGEAWSFLASCREWADAHSLKKPEEFVSHLPIPLDGTCNGLQHLSLLGRDPIGAKATNCSSEETRYDIYIEVANVVREAVAIDAAAGIEEAVNWLAQGIDRKVVKRAVMTTPYGVTDRGITDQLINDKHCDAFDGMLRHANYMREKINMALGRTVKSARDIMGYFQEVAGRLAEEGKPLQWTTPSGMKVVQSYWNLHRKRIVTLQGTYIMWDEDKELGLDKRKQTLASAPNIIHSMDAAMLANTLVLAKERGIEAFACIHDSYATHASDTTALARVLRQAAYDIYKDDWLGKLAEEFKASGVKRLPSPPKRGTFDVSEVLDAQYFFA